MKKLFGLARHWFWIAPLVIGLAFIGGGIYMVTEGQAAHDDVQDSITQEGIIVAEDAAEFAGEPVDSADKAQAQSDIILQHTLTSTGGYLYAEMGRFSMPEGNYMLPNGTYMTEDGSTTTDVSQAATDDEGAPINVTTDEALAAKNANDQPIRAWTNSAELAAEDSTGAPVANPLRTTAQNSAFLRTSLGVAVMGFRVSDLVMGLGAFMIVMGATLILFLAPAVYYAAEVANEREVVRKEGESTSTAGETQPQV
jgi:hypothetical protein